MLLRYLLITCCLAATLPAFDTSGDATQSLNGEWRFAPDYLSTAENSQWPTNNDAKFDAGWDKVTVPHCWSVDPRYPAYVGTGWYRRTFKAPTPNSNQRTDLRFGAVFYRAKVWLNGALLGEHEGGYTPFTFDVTGKLKQGEENLLVVAADNRWSTETIPGARNGSKPNDFVYPWFDFGGITRGVELVTHAPVFIRNAQVVADPDLQKGNANVSIVAYISNAGAQIENVSIDGVLQRNGRALSSGKLQAKTITIGPGQVVEHRIEMTMPASDVELWDIDRPYLYEARLAAQSGSQNQSFNTTFGIRKVETRNAQLLLNGRPIKLGGANRVADDLVYGSIDPPEVVERDLRQMKEAGMELMRIAHYPVSTLVSDWADRHGMLLIEEAGSWGFREKELDSPVLRTKLQSMAKEMIERDWNHPSIIGWSVGNEYHSNLPAGLRWTQDMRAYFRSIDRSRLITFADNNVWQPNVKTGDDDGSRYSDLVGINPYGSVESVAKRLDLVHMLYPDKPVMMTEWGLRADTVKSEAERQSYAVSMMQELRKRPWMVGASLWVYNDYWSRYPGTNRDGTRPWGTVNRARKPYPFYDTIRNEFSPVIIGDVVAQGSGATVQVKARNDFPVHRAAGYFLVVNTQGTERRFPVPELEPGAETKIAIDQSLESAVLMIERPGGFRSYVQANGKPAASGSAK